MFVVENDRICRESAVSVGEGGRVSAKAMRRPVPAAVIQRRTRKSLVSTMPAQCFIRPSIQRSPQYTVHAAQAHSALTWFSPPVETVAPVVAAEQSPATWSHRLKNKDPVAMLKDDNGVEIIENSGKAEQLERYFAPVITRETEFRSRSANNAVETTGPVLDSTHFPTAVVERELKNLKEAKSSGPDTIPAKFLKELANELPNQLTHIIRSVGRRPRDRMGDTTADTSDPTDAAGADGDHPVPLVTSTSTSSETHPEPSSSLWGIIYNILSDPTPRRRLKQYSTLDSVVKLINSSSRILVLTGAGISVSCGIPDFRSRDGIYARLAQDYPDLTSPQAMFEMDFFLHNPLPFFKFAKEIFPGQFKPSLAHWFISLLERKGKLLRNYTQNIDTLEQQAGISRIIQCHGSFATATCTTCSYRVPGDAIRDSILGQTVPRCPKCCPSPPVALSNGKAGQFSPTNAGGTSADESTTGPDAPTPILSRCLRSRGPIRPPPEISSVGVMKPDIVFFGEGLPSEFHSSLAEDIKQTDLVIVMGSSLKVRPVSHIPFSIPVSVPQVLINRESLSSHTFDVELLGDCDVVLDELCSRLGWRVPQDISVPLEETVVPPASKRTEVDLRVPLKAAVMSRHQQQTSVLTQKEVEEEDVESTKATIELSDPQSTEPACDVKATKATVLEPAGPTGDYDSTLTTVSAPAEEVSEIKTQLLSTGAVSVEVLPDESATPMTAKSVTESAKMCSQPSGDNTGTGEESSPIDVDRLVDADDLETDFHLAKFLQENTFTRIPPNQYVFKGAELPFDYEMAEDCLQHEGDLFGDPSSSSSPDSSSASLSPSTFSELATGSETSRNVAAEELNHRGDRVVARLLRKCRADPELQRCLQAKAGSCGASNGSLSANHERPETGVNAVPQDAGANEKGEDEDCVILSEPSLSPPTSQQKNNDQGVPTTDTGLVAKSTDGADFPNAKRRKCDPTRADPPPTASSAQSPVPATDAAATAAFIICAYAGIEVTKDNQLVRFRHRRQEGVQVLVEFVSDGVGVGHRRSVGADDGGEFAPPPPPERQAEAHQAIVDALRQTGQSSHDVVSDSEGDTRVTSLCLGPTTPEGVTGTHLFQLALFGETGLAECGDVHLVARQFSCH
nr:unnamed protein product [Spirometra erinaceieuropaei]